MLTFNGTLAHVAAQGSSSTLKDVPSGAISGTIALVIDGDEFTAEVNGKEYRFNFLGLEAPDAPSGSNLGDFGYDSAMRLTQLLKEGSAVYFTAEGSLDLTKANGRN